jgi:hypothetical protein
MPVVGKRRWRLVYSVCHVGNEAVREKFAIRENAVTTFEDSAATFCLPCTLSQMARATTVPTKQRPRRPCAVPRVVSPDGNKVNPTSSQEHEIYFNLHHHSPANGPSVAATKSNDRCML